mgnify:CR=1 FL=1
MIRHFTLIALMAAVAIPALPADRYERTQRPQAVATQVKRSASATAATRALIRADVQRRAAHATQRSATGGRSALPAAPGVIQINQFDSGGGEAYFTLTDFLPQDTLIEAYIVPADANGFELGPQTFRLSTDFYAGDWLTLPSMKTMRQFGPPDLQYPLVLYYVIVTLPDGTQSWSGTDFSAKDYYRTLEDTAYMIPGINWYRQYVEDGVPYIELTGRFLPDMPVSVVFETFVAPPEAVTIIDATTVRVNMSAVPGFDTSTMAMYLLTVGQDGWTDTYAFRYTPL